MNARLRGQVNLDPGNRRAQRAYQSGVGNNQGVGTQLLRVCPQCHRVGQLVVEHKYVKRRIHAHTIRTRHGTAAGELVVGKAVCAHAGVEPAQARIDGIGTRCNRREHLIESAGRRQQLGQRRLGSPRLVIALSTRPRRPNRHRQTPYQQGMHSL